MGGYFISFVVILTFLVTVGSTAFSSWWLAVWINAGGGVSMPLKFKHQLYFRCWIEKMEHYFRYEWKLGSISFLQNTTVVQNDNETIYSDNINDNPDFWYYQTVYGATIGIILLASLLRTLVFTKATIGASTKLHNKLLKKIIQSPMRFFDTTPMGRIQHLFSRDVDEGSNNDFIISLVISSTFLKVFFLLMLFLFS